MLRKQPELQCCRVLKSLALLRLGREEEAETILDKVPVLRAYSITIQLYKTSVLPLNFVKNILLKSLCNLPLIRTGADTDNWVPAPIFHKIKC